MRIEKEDERIRGDEGPFVRSEDRDNLILFRPQRMARYRRLVLSNQFVPIPLNLLLLRKISSPNRSII